MTLTITDIEVHRIEDIGYQPWLEQPLRHLYGSSGLTQRTVYVVHTDAGLVGLGEGHGDPPEVVQSYIGTSPFDHVNDQTSLGLGTAMYDLMGKATGKPVWKLFGPRARSWVPVSAWYVSHTPAVMAAVVAGYAAMGHTWMKFHLSPLFDVIAQVEAIQAAAPEGFRIHFECAPRPTLAPAGVPQLML
jgi:L-alanine-DL-glutamate epimerase-like enolase superfamily enzyme